MEKRISTRELAAIKRIAMNVNPLVVKKNKAKEKIDQWTKEYEALDKDIKAYESGIIAQLGLRTEQVVTKVVEPTGKTDKNGKEVKATKYIINPNVRFDSNTSEYVVTIEDKNDGDKEVAPVNENPMQVAVEQAVDECTDPVIEEQQEVAEQPEEVLEESFQF
jgi:hypothetical protein